MPKQSSNSENPEQGTTAHLQITETKLTPEFVVAQADLPAAQPSGGDFHTAFRTEDGAGVSVVMGDVAGHGPEKTAQAEHMKELLSDCLSAGLSPAHSLNAVNAIIEPDPHFGVFGTVFVGTIESKTGKLKYASAGHEPGLLAQSANPSSDSLTELAGSGPPVGAFPPDFAEYTDSETILPKGGTLLLYTDGISDVRHAHRKSEWLGLNRLKEIFGRLSRLAPRTLVGRLFEHVSEFCRGQFHDDAAVMAVRRRLSRSRRVNMHHANDAKI